MDATVAEAGHGPIRSVTKRGTIAGLRRGSTPPDFTVPSYLGGVGRIG
ncbi:hypothetical protein ABZ914_22240 [Spirillospora sp. NPDC046719]